MLCSILINLFGSFLALSTRAALSSFRDASSRRDSHVASLSVASSRSEYSTKARVPRAAEFPVARSVIAPYRGRRGCSDQRHWEVRYPLDRRDLKFAPTACRVAMRAPGEDRVQRRSTKAAVPIASQEMRYNARTPIEVGW